jgi:hypothetical protein
MSLVSPFKKRYASKKNKYSAKPCVIDGFRFDSQKEARRYGELKLLERAGEIERLELQPSFDLLAWTANGSVRGKKVGVYRADFQYHDNRINEIVVEDVKGVRTPVYKLKKKMVEACYDIKITEI